MKFRIDVDEDGHLTLQPEGARRSITRLVLFEEGMSVTVADCASVLLRWDDFSTAERVLDGRSGPDHWVIRPWMQERHPCGIGIFVGGAYEERTAALFRATGSVWRRVGWATSGPTGKVLPVLPAATMFSQCNRERGTMNALAAVLHAEPPLRSRLDDGDRMRRLANDLRTGSQVDPRYRTGSGRDATDIMNALRQGGLAHQFRRPLSPAWSVSLGEMVDKVEESLRANPYRAGRSIDRRQVEAIVRREVVDVAPWPFAALVDG